MKLSENWTQRQGNPRSPGIISYGLICTRAVGLLSERGTHVVESQAAEKGMARCPPPPGTQHQRCPCIRDKGITRSKGIRYRLQGKGGLPMPAWRTVAEPAGTWELCKEHEVPALHPGTQAASRAELCFPEEENGISV